MTERCLYCGGVVLDGDIISPALSVKGELSVVHERCGEKWPFGRQPPPPGRDDGGPEGPPSFPFTW